MDGLSFPFFAFLAGSVLLYYLVPLKGRKWVLLAASAVFWASAGPVSAVCILLESLFIWGNALWIARARARGRTGRGALGLSLVLLFAFLLYSKEAKRLPVLCPALSFLPALPVTGISYFTFMGAGWLIEVYRGKAGPEKNPLKVLLFCGFFPQLSQGPIGTWKDLQPQLDTPHPLEEKAFGQSVFLLAWGCFKKLVLADRLAPFTAAMTSHAAQLPGWLALLTGIGYTLQLYADFSGGIDIVRGAAGLFGIRLAQNFRRPFFSRSVGEFWRRWHITLGTWFKSYVLYPIALSKGSLALGRAARARLGPRIGPALPGALAAFFVFVLIGLWHALHWNALLYGCWFGLLSFGALLTEPFAKAFRKKHPGLVHSPLWHGFCLVRTWLLVLFAQFFACTDSPAQAMTMLGQILFRFSPGSIGDLGGLSFYTFRPLEGAIAAAAAAIMLAVDLLWEHDEALLSRIASSRLYIRWPLLMLLLLSVLIFGVYGAGVEPEGFVYANF